MAVTFTITDNADGTGGVATFAGSEALSVNRLYYTAWTGDQGSLTPTLFDSRSGDGTIAINLAVGYYLWTATNQYLSGAIPVANMVYQNLTDATTALHYRILQAVKNRIASLSLSGLTSANIKVLWTPITRTGVNASATQIIVSPTGAETNAGGTTSQDDAGYPAYVSIIDPTHSAESAENLARNLKWREQIMRSLTSQRLSGITPVMICEWVPDAVVSPEFFKAGIFASPQMFRFKARQTRGLT